MTKTTYKESPFGEASDFPWLNKPDTKFDATNGGAYKTGLDISGPEAEALKEEVDAGAKAVFERITGEMPKGEAKKWTIYSPCEELEDAEGNPTGVIRFYFKQNALIPLKSGEKKAIKVFIVDSAGKDITKPVFAGTIIRVMYKMRDIKIASAKQAGVRLDFAGVQVKEFKAAGRPQFGSVDGGYVDEPDDDAAPTGPAADSSDY